MSIKKIGDWLLIPFLILIAGSVLASDVYHYGMLWGIPIFVITGLILITCGVWGYFGEKHGRF